MVRVPSRRWRFWAGVLLALALAATVSEGQPMPAGLVADQVSFDQETGLLTASGDVEVLYQGRVLRAARIVYDQEADEIRAEGPLVLTDPDGGVLLAGSAAMTPDLTEGLITSARLLIANQLQLAATEMRRTGGRYTSLYHTIASSCTICAENPTPTWAIRASRITQDAEARRIYFENARLEFLGVPVALVPRMSIPEPGVERASGVLVPKYQSSEIYGVGFKLPYYRVLGPYADATVTPFVTTSGATLIEGEYRRRYSNGGFDISGVLAVSNGSVGGGTGRGAFHALGSFALPQGFIGDFDINFASDDTFLAQFDYSDADLLTSTARLMRTRENDFLQIDTVAFQSLRQGENTSDVPFIFPEFTYRRLVDTPRIGGRLGLYLQSLGVIRQDGDNVLRGGGAVDWQRQWMLPQGVVATGIAAADVAAYQVWSDPGEPDGLQGRAVPTASLELRWPWVRATGAAQHVIEPIVQGIYSTSIGNQEDIPNNDSQLPEFDDLNLYSLNRFPGEDRLETGARANLGISYTRYDPTGWSVGFTLGRVLRPEPNTQFSEGTGLRGSSSDYVGSLSLDFDWGLTMVNRSLFDSNFAFQRNEFALAYDGDRGALRAAYVYLAQDDSNPELGPQPETNEFDMDARYRFHPNWELRGLWRYDLASNSNLRAGAAITYGNECAEFDLSVSRRYTSSDNLPPSTSVGFTVRLAGIGEAGDRQWPARVCMARGT
jgi:LPS-assembly protein